MEEPTKPITHNQKVKSILLGELHIWTIPVCNSAECFEEYKSYLSEIELNRISFFEFEQVKYSYVVSQGALRKLLSDYIGIPPDKIELGRMNKGKPFSLDDPGLHFNLSNSGNLVVIAFSRDSELGVDIEELRDLPDLDVLIERNFTVQEKKYINAKPERRLRRFFRSWTIKEAFQKAIGEGMRLLPRNIAFIINSTQTKLLSVKGVSDFEDWNFIDISLPEKFLGTVAYKNEKSKLTLQELETDK